MPDTDDAALRRLAADLRELEAVLGGVARDATWVIDDVRRMWSGAAAAAAPEPLQQLVHDVGVLRHALNVFADELDRLAAALVKAKESHDWSWRKVAAVSLVVGVTAGAVVVAVVSWGSATPAAVAAESAVVSVAAGEMAAAATVAATAEAAAVEGLLLASRLARAVQAMRAIVIPRVTVAALRAQLWLETPLGGAALGAATTAGSEWLEDGHVEPADVALAALLGAGENYILSPGRSRGFVKLTERRLATMQQPARRRQLTAMARASAPQHERPLTVPRKQLQTHHKHAKVFGVSTRYNKETAAAHEDAIRGFVAAPTTIRINGSWNSQQAIVYADYDTRVVVICRRDGRYWTGFELRDEQFWHLWHDHAVGGR
jgi:hypothetical protein